MQKLDEKALNEAVAKLPGWRLDESKLVRDYAFHDFVAAMAFVNKIAGEAENGWTSSGHRYPLQQGAVGSGNA